MISCGDANNAFRFVLACLLCAAFSFPTAVHAQSVEDARRHYLEAEFDEAIAAFEALHCRPSLDAIAAVEGHSRLMTLRMLLGDVYAARVHAAFAFSLDPAASVLLALPLKQSYS